MHFRTNKAGYQNSWELKLNNDQVILQRDDFDSETLYVDTVTFMNGCYKYYMYDTGHNGISFWANNQGSGLLRWYDLDGNVLKVFNGDFGDQIYHSFYTDMFLDISNIADNTFDWSTYFEPTLNAAANRNTTHHPNVENNGHEKGGWQKKGCKKIQISDTVQ